MRGQRLPTDFERYGLFEGDLAPDNRALLLTIDFEAFSPDDLDRWLDAMRQWTLLSTQGGWRFSIFLAIEDVVRLRAAGGGVYDRFLGALRELFEAGTRFYPHNHGVFDERTGLLAAGRRQRVPGYAKRASFAYDVVHRHGQNFSEWINRVVYHYDSFLSDAGIPRPQQLAFRAGGWDHGDTAESTRAFVRALERNSFSLDSSASSGVFGTPSWRIGAPFGSNVFALSPSIIEVAPCWSLDLHVKLTTRYGLASLRRLLGQPRLWRSREAPGAFVTVLHFDHLLRPTPSRDARDDPVPRSLVQERTRRFFRLASIIRAASHLNSATFEELSIRR